LSSWSLFIAETLLFLNGINAATCFEICVRIFSVKLLLILATFFIVILPSIL